MDRQTHPDPALTLFTVILLGMAIMVASSFWLGRQIKKMRAQDGEDGGASLSTMLIFLAAYGLPAFFWIGFNLYEIQTAGLSPWNLAGIAFGIFFLLAPISVYTNKTRHLRVQPEDPDDLPDEEQSILKQQRNALSLPAILFLVLILLAFMGPKFLPLSTAEIAIVGLPLAAVAGLFGALYFGLSLIINGISVLPFDLNRRNRLYSRRGDRYPRGWVARLIGLVVALATLFKIIEIAAWMLGIDLPSG